MSACLSVLCYQLIRENERERVSEGLGTAGWIGRDDGPENPLNYLESS